MIIFSFFSACTGAKNEKVEHSTSQNDVFSPIIKQDQTGCCSTNEHLKLYS